MSDDRRVVEKVLKSMAEGVHSEGLPPCPFCGYQPEAVGVVHGDACKIPKKGDFNMCFRCGSVAIHDEEKKTRIPTNDEMAELKRAPAYRDVEEFQEHIRRYGKHRQSGS